MLKSQTIIKVELFRKGVVVEVCGYDKIVIR